MQHSSPSTHAGPPATSIGILDTNILMNIGQTILKISGSIDTRANFESILAGLSKFNNCILMLPSNVEDDLRQVNERHANCPARRAATGLALSVLNGDFASVRLVRHNMEAYSGHSVDLLCIPSDIVKVFLITNDKILQLIALVSDITCSRLTLYNESVGIRFVEFRGDLWDVGVCLDKIFGKIVKQQWRDEASWQCKDHLVDTLTRALCIVDQQKRFGQRSTKRKCSLLYDQTVEESLVSCPHGNAEWELLAEPS
ncbi:uncharacterized protein LOC129582062 [Paramacrobiotus metropolitanus]|uniref:uncharacterized protein LOC129582062 n=1 Tax=Paramacrobiotus metropolitanus TaxID=2943436 RepID=UPI002445E2ED|nr:uncharacterized protein LOC129582062 [Paramacrobiotus metropolitanus]